MLSIGGKGAYTLYTVSKDSRALFQEVSYRVDSDNNQSINQSINLYRAIVQSCVLQCSYAESKRNVLRRILNVLTHGAARQFSGRESSKVLEQQ